MIAHGRFFGLFLAVALGLYTAAGVGHKRRTEEHRAAGSSDETPAGAPTREASEPRVRGGRKQRRQLDRDAGDVGAASSTGRFNLPLGEDLRRDWTREFF